MYSGSLQRNEGAADNLLDAGTGEALMAHVTLTQSTKFWSTAAYLRPNLSLLPLSSLSHTSVVL